MSHTAKGSTGNGAFRIRLMPRVRRRLFRGGEWKDEVRAHKGRRAEDAQAGKSMSFGTRNVQSSHARCCDIVYSGNSKRKRGCLMDVVGVGLNAADTVIPLPEYPDQGSKVEFHSVSVLPGGQVASAMVACQTWGLRT